MTMARLPEPRQKPFYYLEFRSFEKVSGLERYLASSGEKALWLRSGSGRGWSSALALDVFFRHRQIFRAADVAPEAFDRVPTEARACPEHLVDSVGQLVFLAGR